MFKFSPHERYMMPAHFGPMPQGEKSSGWYHDVTMMVVPYLTDRDKLAGMLPHPFEVAEQPVVTVVYACSKDVDWLAGRGYNLIAVTASAVFKGENEQLEGQYSLVWWENLADAILSGRELTGIPKIFADIPDHSVTDGLWQTNVSHFGSDILNMSINHLRAPTSEEMAAAQEAQEGKDHPMGWRYLPRVGGFGAAISQPTTFPSESVYTGAWIGEGTIDWNHLTWEENPTQCHIVNALADLPILGYLPAMVTTGSTNLFLPERMPRVLDKVETLPANGPEDTAPKTIEEIETVCFVGAGTMGCINSLVAAISGYQVELYDISKETLKQVENRYKEFGSFLVGAGYCTLAALGAAFQRISVGSNLEKAVANADLVSESVPENRELKREIHQKLDDLCPAKTILTTNTSNLLVSEIEDAVIRGDRFAALHSYLASRLVDIVAGPRTTSETIDVLVRYVESLNLVPMVLKKENPGYVMNSLLQSLLMTANALVVEEAASVEDVDRAYMIHMNAPMGPFGIMDMIGLDLIDSAMSQVQESIWMVEHMKEKIAALFQTRVERGEFGVKSGKGFYTYPAPAYQQADFLEQSGNESEIYQALANSFIRRAVTIALADVANPKDIDRAWMVGTGIDIGPFGILERMGTDEFLNLSGKLHSQITLESVTDNESIESIESYVRRI
jgi:3-hydroxyacyl-CoA dehydrogenase